MRLAPLTLPLPPLSGDPAYVFPGAAWIPVNATVNGQIVLDPYAQIWPAFRCNHQSVSVSVEVARGVCGAGIAVAVALVVWPESKTQTEV